MLLQTCVYYTTASVTCLLFTRFCDLRMVVVFTLGCASAYLLIRHNQRHELSSEPGHEASSRIYGVDHGVLNIELPLQSMWMNMGYWKNAQSFPQACQHLLEQILGAAGLSADALDESDSGCFLLDLGYGCGDQTLHISKTIKPKKDVPFRYIGITLNRSQYRLAKERVDFQTNGLGCNLFCDDAAKPGEWKVDLKTAVADDLAVTNGYGRSKKWILALDTLYHFRPSRQSLFHYAGKDLGASIAAFDLLSVENMSALDKLFLRVVSSLLSAPFSNFVTVKDYSAQLVEAGYARESISIQDVSEHVFHGLADFLARHETDLQRIGVTSFTRFRLAGWLFKWFAKGHVVKACIVVAKK